MIFFVEGILELQGEWKSLRSLSSEREREAIKRTSDLLQKAESLYNENQSLTDKIDKIMAKNRKREDDLRRRISEMDSENKDLIAKVLKQSKGKKSVI